MIEMYENGISVPSVPLDVEVLNKEANLMREAQLDASFLQQLSAECRKLGQIANAKTWAEQAALARVEKSHILESLYRSVSDTYGFQVLDEEFPSTADILAGAEFPEVK